MPAPIYRLSEQPDPLHMNYMGVSIVITKRAVRLFITTDILTPNPYWRYSGLLDEETVRAYLDGSEEPEVLRAVARYTLIYVENMALSVFIGIMLTEGVDEAMGYLKWMEPTLAMLRSTWRRVRREPSRKLVEEMVWKAIDVGLDPL